MRDLLFVQGLHEFLNLLRPHRYSEQRGDLEQAAARQRTQAAFQRHDSPSLRNDWVYCVALKLGGRGAGRERGTRRKGLWADGFGRRRGDRYDCSEENRQRDEDAADEAVGDRDDRRQEQGSDAHRSDDAS